MEERISDELIYSSNYLEVLNSRIHYLEVGTGDPILFLHGVPTSSYLWRNIIPYLSSLGRCIAPDLIGFGQSDKPDIIYSIQNHIEYINQFIEKLALKNITLVMHGWGSLIGFHYAMSHEKNCKGLVFYESFLRPLHDTDFSLPFQEQLINFQSEENVDALLSNATLFIDKTFPQNVIRQLSENEMENYRRPFKEKGAGKPIVQYLKELSMKNDHQTVNSIIESYSNKLIHSSLPKLLLYSVPGFIATIATVMWAKEHLSHLEVVDIGEELHLGQESRPDFIGKSIGIWLQAIDQQ